jgi:hypothetical protein
VINAERDDRLLLLLFLPKRLESDRRSTSYFQPATGHLLLVGAKKGRVLRIGDAPGDLSCLRGPCYVCVLVPGGGGEKGAPEERDVPPAQQQ